MDRLILEQSGLYHRQPEEAYGVLNATQNAPYYRSAERPSSPPAQPAAQASRASTPSANPTSTYQNLKQDDKVPNSAGPPAFYTATSLYRSQLPTSGQQRQQQRRQFLSEDDGDHDDTKPAGAAPRPISTSSPLRNGATTASSRWPRAVPAPTTYDVVAAKGTLGLAEKRYPSPPWWRRQTENAAHEHEERDAALSGHVDGPASPPAVTASVKDHNQNSPKQLDSEQLHSHDRERQTDHRRGSSVTSPARAPPPPPSRSHTRSVAARSCSATASFPGPPSPSPTNPTVCDEDDNEASPPPSHVDPVVYTQQTKDNFHGRHPLRAHDASAHHVAALPSNQDGLNRLNVGEDGVKSVKAYQLYRDGSASSTLAPTTTTAVAIGATIPATTPPSARLRVFQESAAHPSGFDVPRRGAGRAAPRTLYNGLAVLPATSADSHAIARASTMAGHGGALYGTGNHPSVYSVQKYRAGIAAVTGIDPARLREGVLNQRYTRVRSGWAEGIGEEEGGVASNTEVGMQLHSTTTRLRWGLSGGGAPRALALQDPISGLSRKPTEVSSDFVQQAVREAAAERRRHSRVAVLPTGQMLEGNTSDGTSSRGDSVGSAPAQSASSATSLVHARGMRGAGACSLAAERRRRTESRLRQLHATHNTAGTLLSAEEKRLYWAEHAPLHHVSVRGLNALLQGVGEAEADELSSNAASYPDRCRGSESVSTRSDFKGNDGVKWDKFDSCGVARTASMRRTARCTTTALPEQPDSLSNQRSRTQRDRPHSSTSVSRPRRHSSPADRARAELQSALQQRYGMESTLTTSSILPAAYRHSLTPLQDGHDGSFDAAAAAAAAAAEAYADMAESPAEFENEVYYETAATQRCSREKNFASSHDGERDLDTTDNVGDRTMGLVDSYVNHSAAGTSLNASRTNGRQNTDRGGTPRQTRRFSGQAANGFPSSVGGKGGVDGWRAENKAYVDSTASLQRPSQGHAGRDQFDAPSLTVSKTKGGRASYAAQHAALLFPPLLTPLLQEVDECLRFHGMPVLHDIWLWTVADQTAVLRSAGFSAAECQTITWELERMIRATSTTCAVAV